MEASQKKAVGLVTCSWRFGRGTSLVVDAELRHYPEAAAAESTIEEVGTSLVGVLSAGKPLLLEAWLGKPAEPQRKVACMPKPSPSTSLKAAWHFKYNYMTIPLGFGEELAAPTPSPSRQSRHSPTRHRICDCPASRNDFVWNEEAPVENILQIRIQTLFNGYLNTLELIHSSTPTHRLYPHTPAYTVISDIKTPLAKPTESVLLLRRFTQ